MERGSPSNALILQRLRHILGQHRWFLATWVALFLAGAAAYVHYAKPAYEAVSSVILEDMSSTLFDSELEPLRRYHRETLVLNKIQEIRSKHVAAQVVSLLPDSLLMLIPIRDARTGTGGSANALTQFVSKTLTGSVIRKTDVIEIRSRCNQPVLAAAIANLAAQILYERSSNNNRLQGKGARSFIEEQLALYSDRLAKAEDLLREYKVKHGISSLDREGGELLKRLSETEALQDRVLAEERALRQKLETIKRLLRGSRDGLVPAVTDLSHPRLQVLKQNLVRLQGELTQLQVAKYGDTHPKVRQLRAEIAENQSNLREAAINLSKEDNLLDPLSQIRGWQTQQLDIEIQLETVRARSLYLQQLLDKYASQLRELPAISLAFTQLQRNRDLNEKIFVSLREKLEEVRIAEAERISGLRILDQATVPQAPVWPKPALVYIVACMVALVSGLGMVLTHEVLKQRVHLIEDLESVLDAPILGKLPHLSEPVREGNHIPPSAVAINAVNVLCSNLQLHLPHDTPAAVGVTSLRQGEGKSSISFLVAQQYALAGKRVLIIDADVRRPKLHNLFEVPQGPGLTDILYNHFRDLNKPEAQRDPEDNNLIGHSIVKAVCKSRFADVDVLASGMGEHDPASLFSQAAVQYLVAIAASRYEMVLVDCPPLLNVPETRLIASGIGQMLLVVDLPDTNSGSLQQANKLLQRIGVGVTGLVANRAISEKLYEREADYV